MRSETTPHRPFPNHRRASFVADLAIAGIALAGSLAQLSHGGIVGQTTGPGELDAVSATLAALSALPLLAWRAAPRLVLFASAAATLGLALFGYAVPLPLGSAAALFLYAASRGEGEAWAPRGALEATALFAAYALTSWLGDGEFSAGLALHCALLWALAWFAGEWTRLRHEHVAELAESARRSERDAERERLLAVAEERARIARDLHDSAGHAINVIAVRAGAARLREDSEHSQSALAAIEELSSQTAAEIDQIVGALRDPGEADAVAAPRGLGSLEMLLADSAGAGLEVSLEREGEPRVLATAVDQAAYRILQEALTNATRYGEGNAEIKIAFTAERLELAVVNRVGADVSARANGGHGLVGMRERANLVGGSLDTERVGGRFRVWARLPYGRSNS